MKGEKGVGRVWEECGRMWRGGGRVEEGQEGFKGRIDVRLGRLG